MARGEEVKGGDARVIEIERECGARARTNNQAHGRLTETPA